MVVAVNPTTQHEFIPDCDKGSENPTKFFYMPMKESEKADMTIYVSGRDGEMPEKFLSQLVFRHLVGWENFNDTDGNPIKFTPQNVERVPWSVILEIGTEIIGSSGFMEVERKN